MLLLLLLFSNLFPTTQPSCRLSLGAGSGSCSSDGGGAADGCTGSIACMQQIC